MKKIITHDNRFHADDIFAVATLKKIFNEIEVIRTRDPLIWKTGDIVLDVGGRYDADSNYFDHHQAGGAGRRANGIPYAAFGLIWKKFGQDYCMGNQEVAAAVEEKFVIPIDSHDNGEPLYDLRNKDIEPIDIADVIGCFVPAWDESRTFDEQFKIALAIASQILDRVYIRTKSSIEARKIVQDIYNNTVDKRLVILEKYYPWNEALQDFSEITFVIHPDTIMSRWILHTVPVKGEHFVNRKNLPKEWAGKNGKELQEITGVSDAEFCHNKLFIAVARSKDGALELARQALEK